MQRMEWKAKPVPQTKVLNDEGPEVSIWKREITLGKAFGGKEKQLLFQQLSVLLGAGLSITESLEVFGDQHPRQKVRVVVKQIGDALNEGKSFSTALGAHSQYFSVFEVQSILMAERAGQMVAVLKDLALYHEKRQKLQRKFVQAFTYPIVVLLIAAGVVFFMVRYVVPMFSDVFARFGAELPGITLLVLKLSEFATEWGWLVGLVLLVAGVVLFQVRETEQFRAWTGYGLLKVPVLGSLILKIQLSRFCYTLALMLRARVNLDQTLLLMEEAVRFVPLQKSLAGIRKDVEEGHSLHEAMGKHKIYPALMRQMVRVGEKTARLDVMMDNLARTLEDESETGVTTLTNLLEPLLIIVLGLVVGVILVSMYLPMFQLSNTIGG